MQEPFGLVECERAWEGCHHTQAKQLTNKHAQIYIYACWYKLAHNGTDVRDACRTHAHTRAQTRAHAHTHTPARARTESASNEVLQLLTRCQHQ